LHVESGWVPPGTRIAEMESAVRTVCEPIFNRPLKEISYGHVLLRLFEIARRFDMVIQPQLILLQKTLINVEGLGRELYPDLDVWSTAGPVLRSWMRERIGPRALVHNFRKQLPDMLEALNELPAVVKDAALIARGRGTRDAAARSRHHWVGDPARGPYLVGPGPGGRLAGLEHAGTGRRMDPGGTQALDMSTRLR
jgi:ubiquinone biosynthesis protein